MSSVLLRLFLVGWWCLGTWPGAGGALAQPAPKPAAKRGSEQDRRPDPSAELDLIESTERSEDPLGIDDSTGKELDQAAARLPKPKPVVVLPAASQGAALSSIAGVRESAHELTVKLEQGLAFVTERITFVSTAKHAAEIAYRVPLATSAVITRIAVCATKDCSEAAPEPRAPDRAVESSLARGGTARFDPHASASTPSPSLLAVPIEDERGRALALRSAQIAAGGTLELALSYVAEAKIVGGRARFRVETRGYDPNLVNTTLHVEAPHLHDIQPGAELTLEPWSALEVTASLPGKKSLRADTNVTEGLSSWSRHFEALPPEPAELRPTWLWIDASPSMEGPARSRVSAALAALLTVLPEATDVRAFAFAARASELGRFRADEAPLVQLSDATLLDLDAATQLSSVIALAHHDLSTLARGATAHSGPRARPRVVVISDGLFETAPRERDALLGLRKLGIETWLVALGDGPPRLADAFQHVLSVAPLAEAALHGSELAPLEDALRCVAAKTVRGALQAGEQQTSERAPKRGPALRAGTSWLVYWSLRSAPPTRWSTPPRARDPSSASVTIRAIPYLDRPRPAAPVDTGLPKESVLSMLRTQLVPQARACLRVDRKGRGDYAVGLAFHALFAQREVYDARVEGHIDGPLRSCLMAILPKLRVPAFTGRIRVRYPIYTERVEEPPVIELEPDTEQQLERAFSPAKALP